MRFVDPLAQVEDRAQLHEHLDQHIFSALRVFAKLMQVMRPLLERESMRALFTHVDDERSATAHRRIEDRLGVVDSVAAAALREAYAWFVELLPLFSESASHAIDDEAFARLQSLDEDELVAEMEKDFAPGRWLAFLRLELLVLAATDVISRESEALPPLIGEWCLMAMGFAHEVVAQLRNEGIPLSPPTIPGFTAREWREYWADRVLEGLSDVELATFDKSLVRRRSGRAS